MTTYIGNYLRETTEPVLSETTCYTDMLHQDDDWESLVSEAAQVVEAETLTFWAKGELALRCTRRYGEKSLAKFGSETGLGAGKSLYEQGQLAAFYPPGARKQVPTLLREHFKQAYRSVNQAKKPIENKLGAAMWFLKQAEENRWSAAEMSRQMKAGWGEEYKERWSFQPSAIRQTDEGAVLVLSKEDGERLAKALAFQGKERFEAAFN